MLINYLVIGSAVAFHLGTAVLALRLIRITGVRIAWILIAVSIVFQLIRRVVSLGYLLSGRTPIPIHDDLIALTISFFMFVGVAWIAPMFQSIRRSEEMMKAAMLKAEEEKAKTASIIAAIGDGISIQDRDLGILYQNGIHISYFGDHRGEKCHQAYRQMGSPCTPCPVMISIEDGKIRTTEMVKPTLNGASCFEITTSPLRDGTGRIIAGIEVVRNIDRRKKLEQEREVLIGDLQEALANIKTLRGLLPICAACKKIRDDQGYWKQLESFIEVNSEAKFSHGICPDCAEKLYPEYYKRLDSSTVNTSSVEERKVDES